MFYNNNFRDFESEDFEEFENFQDFDDYEDLSREDDYDTLPCCPYRQFMPPPPPGQHQGPGGGGYGPPSGMGHGQHGTGVPYGPPPAYTPKKQQPQVGVQPQFVEPITLRRCLFRYVYIWPIRGRGFWAWLIYVGRRSIAGYRWNGNRWVYFGMDLRQVESFQCR